MALGSGSIFSLRPSFRPSSLKGTHTQRLTSSFNLKVRCNFTLKPHIKTALRQHKKSHVDHHNIKLRFFNVGFCLGFGFLMWSHFPQSKNLPVYLIFLIRFMKSRFIKTRLRSRKIPWQSIKDQTLVSLSCSLRIISSILYLSQKKVLLKNRSVLNWTN